MNNSSKEKLVVEVVAAHNLMPKDGEGSSSPFVETYLLGPVIPATVAGGTHGAYGVGIYHGGGIWEYSTRSNEFALKETIPHLGGVNKPHRPEFEKGSGRSLRDATEVEEWRRRPWISWAI
ncbi:C2 domain-containing protein [Abeliophyllum distichum]|uniref:C2 domain-containing protein n=1 Tax=Abeliophyllum distichum TaxID=126358 RepID=A0ABD1UF98_9LAMI